MIIPSFNALLDKVKRIRVIQDLCESVSKMEDAAANSPIKTTSDNGVYIIGVGGFDGTNEEGEGVKSLQEVLDEMARISGE